MILTYKKGKNSVLGNPRIIIVDYPITTEFVRLLNMKGAFRKNKKGEVVSVANAGWVYAVSNNATIDFHGTKVKFKLAD